jgi:putative ABC transport system permease protein
VVEDFHSYNFFNKVQPTIFKLAAKKDYQYLSIKVRNGSEKNTYQAMQTEWIKLFPEIPFQGGYQEDVWGDYFEEMGVHGRFWRMIASIAVLLASLGLYGLVTLNVSGRIKEFSIRKVLGADMKSITMNILNQYMVLFAVALLLGAPISYMLAKMVLNFAYIYHVPVNSLGVAISVGTLIIVLLLVVSTQVRKVLVSSPVQGLKAE